MPRSRGTALLNSVQAADKAISTGATSSESNKNTEAHRDRVEINGTDVTSLVTGGLFSTDATQANSDLRYTSEAQMVSANEQNRRSTLRSLHNYLVNNAHCHYCWDFILSTAWSVYPRLDRLDSSSITDRHSTYAAGMLAQL